MRYPSTDKTPLPISKKKVSPYKMQFFNLMKKNLIKFAKINVFPVFKLNFNTF